jgi:hypothetical protein
MQSIDRRCGSTTIDQGLPARRARGRKSLVGNNSAVHWRNAKIDVVSGTYGDAFVGSDWNGNHSVALVKPAAQNEFGTEKINPLHDRGQSVGIGGAGRHMNVLWPDGEPIA